MKCCMCSGLMEYVEWYSNGEHCTFHRCVNCGDVDFHNGTHEIKRLRRLADKTRRRVDRWLMDEIRGIEI